MTVDNVCEIIKDNETPIDPGVIDITETEVKHVESSDSKLQFEQYVGVYGQYAYGNVTIAMNETGDGLVMYYGRDNYV